MGCEAHALTDNQLLVFFAAHSTDTDEDPDDPPRAVEPIMLDAGGYEKLTPEKIARNARLAERVREGSPPAVGTARLALKDALSADAVVREPDHVRVGGRYRKTRYIDRWPEDAYFGILDCLEALDGRITCVKYVWPRSDEEAEKLFSSRVAELDASAREDSSGDVRTRTHKQNAQYAAHLALEEITNKRQGYARVAVFVHVQADTLEELDALDHQVWRALKSRSIQSRLAREEAWEGFLTCLPLGRDYLTASTDRSMLTDALACTFSYTTPHLQHEDGILIGVEGGGTPVIYDDWRFSSPGSVTLGPPDSGKTFWVKGDATRKRCLGRRVVILDPAANSYYNRVARSIGGEYAFLRPGSPHKLNPFDINRDYLDLALLADALEEDAAGYEEARRKARQSALDSKVSSLVRILALMAGGLSRAETGFAMRVFYECYRRAGITQDPATHDEEPPTFSGGGPRDFFAVLREVRAGSEEVCDSLAERLVMWETGPLSDLFDASTNVDFSNKFLVLQVAALDAEAKPAVMAAAMESVSGLLSNPDELADFYVDEAHNMLYSEDSARFLSDWKRTARVRGTSVHSVSQDTIEFTRSEWGRTILNQVGVAWVFRQQNPKAAAAIADIWGLSESESERITRLRQGVCYLIAGKTRYQVAVLTSEEEKVLFDTSPGSETRFREKQAELAKPGEEPEEQEVSGPQDSGPSGEQSPEEPPDESLPESGTPAADLAALGPLPGENADDPCRIYACTGEGAPAVAAAVARLLADAACERGKGLYVLAVDATTPGGALTSELGLESAEPPDSYLALGHTDVEALGSYVYPARAESPALMAVASPEMDSLSAAPIRDAATRVFDVVVVACGASASAYSAEWLSAADRVVGCSADKAHSALDAALSAEELRGTNASLIATTDAATDAAELDREAPGRALFAALAADADARLQLTTKLITEKEEDAHE